MYTRKEIQILDRRIKSLLHTKPEKYKHKVSYRSLTNE